MKTAFTICFLLLNVVVFSQKGDRLSKEDSLAIINELREELKLMFGSKNESYGDVNVGVGSGFFRPADLQQTATIVSKAVYNLNGGYYHKSGAGIDMRTLFLNDGGFKFFQGAITPSYNYIKQKAFSAGASYTRYFYADSLSFATSPLVNEWQLWGRLKKVILQPGLTVNYAHGTYTEDIPRQGNTPAMTITEKASDFGLMGSIRHNFTWLDVLSTDDAIRITPTLLAVAGTSKYGMNFAVGSVAKNFNRFTIKPKKVKPKRNNNNNNNQQPTTFEETFSTGFAMQSATFVLGSEYSYKSFYIQPQWLVDYSFLATENKWTNIFNVSIGFTF
ncbi:hypothetical protein [Aridibaculum aurantiacum]|uniref:hypothetical protein n=1 Tax=Aridibaculum aurantiacum TaxID=2810307 RepID=UPI001A95D8C4|nr:hypothetical protein [Aridibaculum aurantiacum]